MRFLSFFLLVGTLNVYALSLQDAIDKTLTSHPDGKIAALNVESSQYDSTIAHASLLPKVSLNGSYYPTKTFVMPTNGSFSTKQNDGLYGDISGSYSLWDGGAARNSADAALLAQEGVKSNQTLTNSALVEQTWLRYYRVAYAHALVTLSQSSVKFFQEQYTQALTMRQNGLKTTADEMRFKAALASQNDQLAWALGEVQKANTSLELLTGDHSPNHITPHHLSEQSNAISTTISLDTLHQELKSKNPQLKALESTIAQNEKLYQAYDAQKYGDIDLVAMAGYDDSLSTYDSYQAGVVASIPLYDGNTIDSQTQKGKIAHLKAKQQYDTTQRQLYQELFDAYSDLQRSAITIQGQQEIIAANTQALTLFTERYKQGLSTYIDVLESQNALDAGLAGLAGAHYQKIQSYAKIQKLLYQGDLHVNQN